MELNIKVEIIQNFLALYSDKQGKTKPAYLPSVESRLHYIPSLTRNSISKL
jgi:hypothetical protein